MNSLRTFTAVFGTFLFLSIAEKSYQVPTIQQIRKHNEVTVPPPTLSKWMTENATITFGNLNDSYQSVESPEVNTPPTTTTTTIASAETLLRLGATRVGSAVSAQSSIPITIPVARIYESYRARTTMSSSSSLEASAVEDDNESTTTEFSRGIEKSNGTRSERIRIRKRTAPNDVLSKNISIILENLLKSYERSQLPTHGKGIPTIVRTNMLIRSMGPFSELDMDYSMDCYFRQYWRDKRLSFKGPIKSLSLSIKMLDKIWRPDTYFYNGKHSHIHTITVPNKLLRLSQDGDILYSMRLTIKATCPMELRNFPMDRQSCPLIFGSYAYTTRQLVYEWHSNDAVTLIPGMALNQFDLISMPHRNFTFTRREGDFSVLHVSFNLKRHTGYFLIQVYVPCILIVVLSWVSFWIHREATSDRVGLCITAVLTLSTISLDSRIDLPKVKYATALDWFLLMSFFYCIATLLEFAGVHYFTKLGSGEMPMEDDEWEDLGDTIEEIGGGGAGGSGGSLSRHSSSFRDSPQRSTSLRRKNSLICPIYNDPTHIFKTPSSHTSTMERTTQTEPPITPKWKQLWLCLLGDQNFRKQRRHEAAMGGHKSQINSVSLIDRVARVAFPMSFALFNLLYWLAYAMYQKEFSWPSTAVMRQ